MSRLPLDGVEATLLEIRIYVSGNLGNCPQKLDFFAGSLFGYIAIEMRWLPIGFSARDA